jgi:hypothetical protein
MVITILEANVAADMVPALLAAYQNGLSHLPLQMVQTFLLNSTADTSSWKILSVWKSREALEEMRHSRETPEGILMFRAAGVEEPKLAIFEVAASAP